MFRLIFYESRKHFLTPAMITFITLFFVINGIKIYSVYQQSSVLSDHNEPQFKAPYRVFYNKYRGRITDEKISSLLGIYNPIKEEADSRMAGTGKDDNSYTYNVYSDELFFRWCFIDEMKYDYSYKEYADNIVMKANRNISFYKRTGNTYGAKENYKIAKSFYKRKLDNFYNTEMYQYLFYYDFSSLFVIMLCIYGCSSVFVKEEETEMKVIIASGIRGPAGVFAAKWISAGIFVAIACLIFSAEDYAGFALFFKYPDAGGEPLYALQGFKNTLLTISMDQSFILFAVTRLAGVLAIAGFFILVSAMVKSMLPVFVLNFSLTAGMIMLQDYTKNLLRMVNPMSLVSNRTVYSNTEFVNVAGNPVPIVYLCIAAAALFICLSAFVSFIYWKRK